MHRAITQHFPSDLVAPHPNRLPSLLRICAQLVVACCAWWVGCGWAQTLATDADGEWRGSLTAGFSAAAGNTQSTSFNIGAEGARIRPIDKLNFYVNGLYGTKSNRDGSAKAAHQIRGGTKYDYNLSDLTFAFGSLDLERDRLQELDLRAVAGAGFGTHVIKTAVRTFDVFGGLTYNREKFFNESRDTFELLAGEEFAYKLSDSTTFKQRFALYPNLRDRGEFRATLDASMVVAITSSIGLQLTLSDRYISNPQPGIKNNDFLFLTGITVKFGPR
jgi:putative salt-induced outer membrane protein